MGRPKKEKQIIVDGAVVGPSKRRLLVEAIRRPISAIGQFFWDAKANTFSAANLILVVGVAFGMTLMWDTRNMLWTFIDRDREIPDISWYFMEIVGFLAMVIAPYLSKRIGTRHDRYPSYDPVVINKDEIKE